MKSNQTPPPSESSEGGCCLQDLDSITDLLPLGTVDYGGLFANSSAIAAMGGIAAATAAAAAGRDWDGTQNEFIKHKGASIYDVRSGWEEGVPKKQTNGTKSADL